MTHAPDDRDGAGTVPSPPLSEPVTARGPASHAGPATVVFTIVSRNYFHYARNLMASVAEHLPGTRRVVVVCDELDGLDAADADGVELLGIGRLGIAALDRMAVHYTILELNTAVKPFAFERLFERDGVERVVYFDPDIQLFASGAPLLAALQRAPVVLTPHLLAPLADDRHPSDLSIVQSGTYNLGFLALARGAATQALLRWWQGKLVRDCVVDIPRGLFTDQKWIDLVPGFVEGTHVERHPGWNVAYWNLAHRHVTHAGDGRFEVDGRPLFFFHFSGHDPKSGSISKHQDRYRLADCTPAVQALFAQYAERLERFGRARFAALPYAFARLADGTRLPDVARALLRRGFTDDARLPDLRSAAGAQAVVAFLTAPVDARRPAVSALAHELWRQRADLRAAFPDPLGGHREAYLGWFAERAGPEAGIDGVLARGGGAREPAGVAAADRPTAGEAPGPATADRARDAPAATGEAAASSAALPHGAVPPGRSAVFAPGLAVVAAGAPVPVLAGAVAAQDLGGGGGSAAVSLPYRMAYRMAWRARHVLRPLTSLTFRQRMREALIRRAFPVALPAGSPTAGPATRTPGVGGHGGVAADAGAAAAATAALPAGVTVIGYLHAESGVGESARSTLRALAAAGVPHALRDYRVGNVSRMAEAVDERRDTGVQHAVSLFHVNADQLPLARTFIGEAPFRGPYRIGFWAWELEIFPAEWHGAFAHVDEVWVPSTFCQRAIAAVSPRPVLVMPHAVEVPATLRPDRARFGLRPDAVVFLAMADMLSSAGRKNPLGAVEAFVAAFGGDGRDGGGWDGRGGGGSGGGGDGGGVAGGGDGAPQLIVKIANPERDPPAMARLQALAAVCPAVRLLPDPLDRAALNALLDSVDVFVSLHRAEGFGLVIAEAMARGKTVVATGWSGNTDFMDAGNALVVDHRLATLDADVGPYRRGQRWAEPVLEGAVAQLRLAAADAGLRRRLGERARADCLRQLAPAVVGAAMAARLACVTASAVAARV